MDTHDLIIIGIGASAGGLEALQALVSGLPDNSNMAYVVAQHLSPTYKSLMVDLLAKGTDLQVLEAQHGLVIQANTLYICPPNKNIIIRDYMISLEDPKTPSYGAKPSIDLLFESLADSRHEKSVGVILSGTGSDGSRGARYIKAEGGFTIAQDPGTAKYDGMPMSAINTGHIDLILPAEKIGAELVEIFSYPERPAIVSPETENLDIYQSILTKLNAKKGVDFSQYKPSTIQRRMERRMAALKVTSITTYHNHLIKHDEEVEALFKDILIGVTSFFRDREAFDALGKILKKHFENKKEKSIRIWTPGCSTGEEAYSIAIVLSEILGEEVPQYKIQIFATDIDDEATSFARKGVYPESALTEMDKSLRNKYFYIKNDQYEIIKPIREMCIFSRHDITKDPSFLRLDLIACRNLLIYFSQDLQKKLIPGFHYALNDRGLLFLGKSESVGHFQSYFKNLEKKWKIYEASYLGRKEVPSPNVSYEARNPEIQKADTVKKLPSIPDLVTHHINIHILPTCVVINDSFDLIYVKGKNPYLIHPEGERSDNIFRNVIPAISVELRAALHVCKKEQTVVKTPYQKVFLVDDVTRYVRVVIMPIDYEGISDLMLLCFQEETEENFRSFELGALSDADEEKSKKLEFELARTKEHLQTVIEELETSNEEMQSLNEELQSSNEELQSSNEELQSSNEELETTNEELQSTNEELQTAYTEVRAMYDEKEEFGRQLLRTKEELEETNQRLQASVQAARVGVYDYHVPIQQQDYWSEMWANLIGFTLGELPADKENMPAWIKSRIHPDDQEMMQQKYQTFLQGETETYGNRFRMQHKNGNWIWVECSAKSLEMDEKNRPLRIVGTTRDVTEDIVRQRRLEVLTTHLGDVQKIASIGSWDWDIATEELWWSEGVYEIFGVEEEHFTPTLEAFYAAVLQEDHEKVKTAVEQALNKENEYDIEHRIVCPDGDIRIVREKGTVIFDHSGKPLKMLGTIQDLTDTLHATRELEANEERLRLAMELAEFGIWDWNLETGEVVWDRNSYAIFGLEPDSNITYEEFRTMVHPEDLEFLESKIDSAIKERRDFNAEFRVVWPSGEIRQVNGTGKLLIHQGDIKRLVGINMDITDTKRSNTPI